MRFAGNVPEWGQMAPAPSLMRTARMVVVATAIGATAGAAVVLSLIDRPAQGAIAEANKTLVVVHSLVQPAEAAAPAAPKAEPVAAVAPAAEPSTPVVPAAPVAIQASAPVQVNVSPALPPAPAPQVVAKISAPAPSDAHAVSTLAPPATVAALSESPPATETVAPAADPLTADPAASPGASTGPKVVTAPAAPVAPGKKLPVTGQLQAQQHGLFAPPPKKKAGNDGLAPMLRRLFSAN
jgi:hypothetical protein